MPKRTDIHKIMIIGSGPVVIGQAGEYDCACSQACKALREEGYEVVVVDSNPATISTDAEAYIEPLTLESCTRIIEKERPDALLAAFGGQTAINLAMSLAREGALKRFDVELIGADESAIERAEDRRLSNETMQSAGIPVPGGGVAGSIEEGLRVVGEMGFPVILRPAYTLAGEGSAAAYNAEEYVRMLAHALETSPTHQTLIQESLLGWKHIEIEAMRDSADDVAVITSLENIDPLGVHPGDSAAVVPAHTLSAEQLDHLIDLSSKAVKAIGIAGSANIRFAVNPESGDVALIGISPRVSRSSMLASKAVGFPIAQAAAKLAVGLTLDEIGRPDCDLRPGPDYCAVRIPRFAFEQFPDADDVLDTSMKSVGEVVAMGRSFTEALQKAIQSLETGRCGLGADGRDLPEKQRGDMDLIRQKLSQPNANRLFYLRYAIENGMSTDDICGLSRIDPWFIDRIRELVDFERKLVDQSIVSISTATLDEAKHFGYTDLQLAHLLETQEEAVRQRRKVLGIGSTYHPINACGASSRAKKIIILGAGPNRIGQGTEFDYCCVQAAAALEEEDCESIIINCNPAAVSTDYSNSDKLYFEPLTREDVLAIVDREQPMGVIAQFGGRTASDLSLQLSAAGVNVLGAAPESMARAEDPQLLSEIIRKLGLRQTENDVATTAAEAADKAARIGYPVLIGQSCEFGRRAMEIAYDAEDLAAFVEGSESPISISKFLEDATGVDLDAISDGTLSLVCGVMEHIEQAGVHSGDSACSLPPYSLSDEIVAEVRRQSCLLAEELGVVGMMNVQLAVKDRDIYILEVTFGASRTIPFVSKATGIPWAKVAAKILLGKSLREQGITEEVALKHVSVKEAVFPFARFPGVDVVLGPEMRSTGEVMGIDADFGNAYLKAQIAAGQNLPKTGTVFVSVAERDKAAIGDIARDLSDLGFSIAATRGTADAIAQSGVSARIISKIGEGRPDARDLIKNNEIALIVNTPSGKKPRRHEINIRSAVVSGGIPIITTIAGARATVRGLKAAGSNGPTVKSIQEYSA